MSDSATGGGELVEVMPDPRHDRSVWARGPVIALVPASAVAAGTGFLAGAFAVGLMRRRRKRRIGVARCRRRLGRRRDERVRIDGTRSFLIDVHLLSRSR